MRVHVWIVLAVSGILLFDSEVAAYRQLHLCNGSGRRYCANTQRALRCPETCRPQNCAGRPSGREGRFYTRCYQIRPPICQTIYWEEIAATNMYDYVFLNTTMDQKNAEVCMSTCREEPFRGICLASERGVNGVDYCKQIDCRRLKMPNQSGCHQPRDFHPPTCFECEILFPLACGSNAGGVLKGWKTRRDNIIRQRQLKESIHYNASVVEFAKMVDSTFEDTFRWLNGASIPKLPAWYMCAKMNADRVQYVQSLAQQKRDSLDKAQWLSASGNAKEVEGDLCESSDCPDKRPQSSDFLHGLASSEALPHSSMWESNRCKMYYPDVLKMFDSEYMEMREDDDDDNDQSEDMPLDIHGTLDFLPPWIWEPWNQEWEPLPEGMKWYWETMESELSVAASIADTPSTVFVHNVSFELDRDLKLMQDSGSSVSVLTTSAVLAIQAPDLVINAGYQPTVVQVIFQVSDSSKTRLLVDVDAVKKALSFAANYKVIDIQLQIEREAADALATITANIFTTHPVEVAVAFNKADRDGNFAAILAGAELEYLEVSMTTAVTYAGSGFIDISTVETMSNEIRSKESEDSKKYLWTALIPTVAIAAFIIFTAGVIYLRSKLILDKTSNQLSAQQNHAPNKVSTIMAPSPATGNSVEAVRPI